MKKIAAFTCTILSWLFSKMGALAPALIILLVAMVLDYISGLVASAYEGLNSGGSAGGLNSKKGLQGILKKFSYMLVVGIAIIIDYVIINMGGYIGITLDHKSFFSLLITIWFILNEGLSIIENTGRMDVKLPAFLVQIITEMKGKVEK